MFSVGGLLVLVFVFDRGKVLVELLDSRGSEDFVGGECCVSLEVLFVDRIRVVRLDGFVDVLVSDSRYLVEERFS